MFTRLLSFAVLAALLAAPLPAADKNDKNATDKNAKPDKNQKNLQLGVKKGDGLAAFNLPKEIVLSTEQQEKLKALKEEVAPQLGELQKRLDEEGAKLKQLNVERGTILKGVQQKLQALLTDEQKAKLAELKKGKGVDKNAKPDKNAAPLKGTVPDKNAKGGTPDKGEKPQKGALPDKDTKNSK